MAARDLTQISQRWIQDLLTHEEGLESAIDMPIGIKLGCGLYGCVFASTPPWVIKVTIDPLEGPTWAKLAEIQHKHPKKVPAIPRIHDVWELNEPVRWVEPGSPEQITSTVYVIAREAAVPLAEHNNQDASMRTMDELWVPKQVQEAGFNPVDMLDAPRRGDGWVPVYEWERQMLALVKAPTAATKKQVKQAAKYLHELDVLWAQLGNYNRVAARYRMFDYMERDVAEADDSDIREQAVYVAKGMGELPQAADLKQTLAFLSMEYGIIFGDLHAGNLGWRVFEEIKGFRELPPTLVVIDPGVTRTDNVPEIKRLMIANARWGRR